MMINVNSSEAEALVLTRLTKLQQVAAAIQNQPNDIPISMLQHLYKAAIRLAEATEAAGGN